jgi:hypothetical protein
MAARFRMFAEQVTLGLCCSFCSRPNLSVRCRSLTDVGRCVDMCDRMLPASRGGDAVWAQSAAAAMEKPQRARSGLKSSPRGPKSPVQSWTAVLNVSADAFVGAGGDVSVLSTAVMSRLGIASDDGSWRWIALSFPVVGRFVRRVQLAATPLDSRDPTWSLLGHERWAPRVAASVVADAQRGFLL